MKLNDIRVSHKLWATILVLLVSMFAVALSTSRYMRIVENEAAAKIEKHASMIAAATKWKGMAETNIARALAANLSGEKAVADFFGANMKQGMAEASAVQKYLVDNAVTAEDKDALEAIGKTRAVVVAVNQKLTDAKAAGDGTAQRNLLDTELTPATNAYFDALGAFIRTQEKQRDEARAQSEHTRDAAAYIGLFSSALVCALGMLCAAALVRSINQPLSRAVQLAEAIAAGDLTQRIDETRRDEFGRLIRAMQRMNESLANVVGSVLSSTESIGTASAEIATGNLDLSARTEQTASSLEETAASMEQITESVQQNAEAARQANQLTTVASEAAKRGGTVVGEVVNTMEAITAASQKIADIIGVIDGIAFQTNILALNAAVEAARAGEQGRGFAVVAAEVRSLAQRSAHAAKEIKALIDSSGEKVEAGAAQVQTAGATMQEIVASVARVADIMHEITVATAEQSSGIHGVNNAVGHLDQMTQQNAALVEQAAAAAASLQDQAGQLTAAVGNFKVNHVQRVVAVKPAGSMSPQVRHRAPSAPAIKKTAPVKLSAAKAQTQRIGSARAGASEEWEEF
jgi:methyl-accepting chemotaxis protein